METEYMTRVKMAYTGLYVCKQHYLLESYYSKTKHVFLSNGYSFARALSMSSILSCNTFSQLSSLFMSLYLCLLSNSFDTRGSRVKGMAADCSASSNFITDAVAMMTRGFFSSGLLEINIKYSISNFQKTRNNILNMA